MLVDWVGDESGTQIYFHFNLQLSAKAQVGNYYACKSGKSNLTCPAQYRENICNGRLIFNVTVAKWQRVT